MEQTKAFQVLVIAKGGNKHRLEILDTRHANGLVLHVLNNLTYAEVQDLAKALTFAAEVVK